VSFPRSPWIRAVAVALAAVGLYALFGFAIAPWIVEHQLESRLSERSGRDVTVDDVDINPFVFTVSVEGFSLSAPSGDPMVSVERLFVDFELSSVWRGAYVFEKIDLVAPRLRLRRDADGRFEALDVVTRLGATSTSSTSEPEASSETVALVVESSSVERGSVAYVDESAEPRFETELSPLSFRLRDFSTRSGQSGAHRFRAESEAGEALEWSGDVALSPMAATGSVALKRLQLPKYRPYLARFVPFRYARGRLDAGLHYRVALDENGLSVALDRAYARADDVAVRLEDEESPFFALSSIRIGGGAFDFPALEARIEDVDLSGGRLTVQVREDGGTSLDPLSAAAPSSPSGPSPQGPGLAVRIGSATLSEFRIDGAHQTEDGSVPLDVLVEHARVSGFGLPITASSTVGVELRLRRGDRGRLRVESTAGLSPLRARSKIELEELDLVPFAPYLARFARLELPSGSLSASGTSSIAFSPGLTVRLDGDARIDELHTVDPVAGLDFVKWRRLGIRGATVALPAGSVSVERIEVEAPYGRILIRRDRSTNLAEVFRKAPSGPTAPADSSSRPDLRVGGVRVRGGSADFEDRSVTPRFAASIQGIDGRIGEVASSGGGGGRVRLAGRVDRHAPVRVSGEVHPFSTSRPSRVALDFRNMEMTTLTPYAARFAGHVIEKGKLNVQLEYAIRGSFLEGDNEIRIDQLTLGEKVDSPEAVELPVKLAVALLKDRRGLIDLDLPVSGDLDDPEFRVGKVVWKAVLNLMEKAVLSPFSALGGLFSAKDRDAIVPFVAGTATTTPSTNRDLLALETELAERSALVLEVGGRWDPKADANAIARERLDAILTRLGARDDVPGPGLDEVDAVRIREAHRRTFSNSSEGDAPPTSTSTTATSPPLEARVLRPWAGPEDVDPPPRWRTEAADVLERELVDAVPVSEAELRNLAVRRARVVRDVVVGKGRVEPSRVFISNPDAGERSGVRLKLNVR